MKKLFVSILLLLQAGLFAQEKEITGTVVDENNIPLPGATIVVKNSKNGVSTDFEGKYSIKANVGATLVFRYVGYEDKIFTVKSNEIIDVAMNVDEDAFEDVIVVGMIRIQEVPDSSTSSQTKLKYDGTSFRVIR